MVKMIEFESVTKHFSGRCILDDFSITINQGDKVRINGPSGIGKSTIFNLLLGFETPDTGAIFYENKLLKGQKIWELRKRIAYVSQDLYIGMGNVQELFDETFNLKNNIIHIDEYLKDMPDLLERFYLNRSILDKKLDALSRGEKQRIAIINAILLKRKVYLLDECTSALDMKLKEEVMSYFLAQSELTVLFISHDNTDSDGLININLK